MTLSDSHIQHLIDIGFKDATIIDIDNHSSRYKLAPIKSTPFGLIAQNDNRRCIYGRLFRDYDLKEDRQTFVSAYTDGSGVTTDKAVGCAAIVRGPNTHLDLNYTIGPGTNNIAELHGIYLALCTVYWSDIELDVYSDSQYSIGIVSQPWVAKQNKELVSEIRQMLCYREARFHHVKGHNGHLLNELADKLAGQARIKE